MRSVSFAKKFAKSQLPYWGWKGQWACLNELWRRESNWRADAYNTTPVIQWVNGKRKALHAGGIPQRLGLSPKTPVPMQVNIGLGYIKARYGSPCRALTFHNRRAWY